MMHICPYQENFFAGQLSDFSESIRLIYRLVKLGLFSLAYFDMLEYHIGNDYLVTAPTAK